MRFVIVGAGRVGMRTARVLREEDHDVVIIEPDETKVSRLDDEGFDVVQGDGSDEETLLAVGLEDADGIAGLSGDLVVNFVACMIGKTHDCRTVLRVDDDYREYVVQKYASDVDEVIYPERLGAIAAKNALVGGNIRAVADIAQNLQLVQLTITPESPMRGYSLTELELPADSRLLAFGKADGRLELPGPDDSLEAGDRVVIIADFSVLRDVEQIIVGETSQVTATGGA
ncbi:TrkA family potassium uptake protein [Natronomonas gomsonensis]|jgi:trk system potassium uptake protein TrkA|uniref:potassium channel family protein n=1 Tax=Natronomonas gomsonensis TaxID=1046043 RepID=UPI0020CA8F44|nr:TrkA family potassium uptake protein [Natronomonas gomsonensis]MCY4730896.1 TrkA family potassium uptake protein [Natronomonas gomsonensis]